jgi:hypothetical protein
MAHDSIDVSDSFTWEEGLPRPQWEILSTWVESRVEPDDRPAAWTAIGRQWLDRLGEALGPGHRTEESANFLVLAPPKGATPDVLLDFCENCRAALLAVLADVAEYRTGKQVVIGLSGADAYYQYLSVFSPEGRQGASVGVQIREGFPHVALNATSDGNELGATLAHELTHAALQHLGLPLWVEEGLAQMFEHDMTPKGQRLLDAEAARLHKKFWAKHGLDLFWRGEGFTRADKAQKLSYELAEVLMRLLVEDHRPRWFGLAKEPQRRFFAFLREADEVDCGEAAARKHLGMGLGDVAAKFLGPGDWEPGL